MGVLVENGKCVHVLVGNGKCAHVLVCIGAYLRVCAYMLVGNGKCVSYKHICICLCETHLPFHVGAVPGSCNIIFCVVVRRFVLILCELH